MLNVILCSSWYKVSEICLCFHEITSQIPGFQNSKNRDSNRFIRIRIRSDTILDDPNKLVRIADRKWIRSTGKTKKTQERYAFVTFKNSDHSKNALRGVDGHITDNPGKDGEGGWRVSYDPDSVKPPYDLTHRKMRNLPKHLYSPDQLVDYLKNGERVPPKGGGNASTGVEATKAPSPSNDTIASSLQGGNASTGVEATKAPSPSNVTIASSQGVPTLIGQPPPDVLQIPPSKGSQVFQVEGHDNQAPTHGVSNFGGNFVGVSSPYITLPPQSFIATSQFPVNSHTGPAYFPYAYMQPYYNYQYVSHGNTEDRGASQLQASHIYSPIQLTEVPYTRQHNLAQGQGSSLSPVHHASQQPHTMPMNWVGLDSSSVDPYAWQRNLAQGQGSSLSHVHHAYQQPHAMPMNWAGLDSLPEDPYAWQRNLVQGQGSAFLPVHASYAPPGQTMASPTYLQQSQAGATESIAGATESIGSPPQGS